MKALHKILLPFLAIFVLQSCDQIDRILDNLKKGTQDEDPGTQGEYPGIPEGRINNLSAPVALSARQIWPTRAIELSWNSPTHEISTHEVTYVVYVSQDRSEVAIKTATAEAHRDFWGKQVQRNFVLNRLSRGTYYWCVEVRDDTGQSYTSQIAAFEVASLYS